MDTNQLSNDDVKVLKRLSASLSGAQMTQKDFIAAFEQVVKIILNIQSRIIGNNSLERQGMQTTFDELKSGNQTDFSSFKTQANNLISQGIASIQSAAKEQIQNIQNSLDALEENRDTFESETFKRLQDMIPTIQDILEYLPQAGTEIRDALELLQGNDRLDVSAIKNIEELIKKLIAQAYKNGQNVSFSGGTRGFFVYIDGVKKGLLQTIDFVSGDNMNIVYSTVNGRPTLTFNTSGGTWMAPETPIGDIDGVNVTYQLSYVPETYSGFLFYNNQYYNEGTDWTITDNVITMTTPFPVIDPSLPQPQFSFKGQFFAAVPIIPPTDDALLIEDGSNLLLEDGSNLLLSS